MIRFKSEAEAEAWVRFLATALMIRSEMLERGALGLADDSLVAYRERHIGLDALAEASHRIHPPTDAPPGAHNHPARNRQGIPYADPDSYELEMLDGARIPGAKR